MDANFGLVRKRNAGRSFIKANCDAEFFVDDNKVQQFVEKYNETANKNEVCSTNCQPLAVNGLKQSSTIIMRYDDIKVCKCY